MRHIFVKLLLCAACLLLCGWAAADTVEALDGSGVLLETLPMDDYTVYGQAVDPESAGETEYSDPSIQVSIRHEWIGEAHYNIAIIKIAHPSQLRTALYKNSIKKNNYVWVTAAQNNAVVAIGGEFLNKNEGTYTVRMSQLLRTKGKKSRDALFIDQYGDFHITKGFSKDTVTQLQEQGLQIINAFNFGPALIIDGEPVYDLCRGKPRYPIGLTTARQPRTAIGQLGPLEYMLVVVDGRKVKVTDPDGTVRRSPGVDVFTLGEYMLSCGCTQAYTLDGGGSAAMYYAGTGLYSNPCTKRGVTDIIYFASLAVAETQTDTTATPTSAE